MKHRALLSVAILAILGSTAFAQVGITVAPSTAPIGCEVQIALSNDSTTTIGTGACPFQVLDSSGNTVFAPAFCILIFINVSPGAEHIFTWNQTDNSGNQVPAGNYTINFNLPGGGVATKPLTIGGNAGMGQLGVQRLGTAHNLRLCAPGRPNSLYLVLASLTSNVGQPIPGCTSTLPLDPDFLFNLIISGSPAIAPYFPNVVGVLNSNGFSNAPLIFTPNDPALAGASIDMAFVTIDPSFPMGCPVTEVSAVHTVTLM